MNSPDNAIIRGAPCERRLGGELRPKCIGRECGYFDGAGLIGHCFLGGTPRRDRPEQLAREMG